MNGGYQRMVSRWAAMIGQQEKRTIGHTANSMKQNIKARQRNGGSTQHTTQDHYWAQSNGMELGTSMSSNMRMVQSWTKAATKKSMTL